MSMLGIDGFDNYNSGYDLVNSKATTTRAFQWTSANLSVAPGTNFFGYGKCLAGGEDDSLVATLSSSKSTAIWGGHVIIPQNSFFWITGFDSTAGQSPYGGGSTQAGILLTSSNASLAAYRNLAPNGSYNPFQGVLSSGSVLLAQASNNLYPVGSVFLLELSLTIGSAGGAVSVAINGTSVMNITGVNTQESAHATMDSWGWLFGSPPGEGIQIDNCYFLDSAVQSSGSIPFNSFLSSYGLTRVFTSFPTANSGTPAFSPHPNTNTNYQDVDETAMDSDTTYNYASTSGDEDLFTITPLPTGVTPLYCQVKAAVRQTSAGSLALATAMKSGATELDGQSLVSYQTYTYQADGTPVDPATGVAWTNTGVSGLLIGYKETA